MATIGFLGFGEVASRFAVTLQASGAQILVYDVLLDRPGGADKLATRTRGSPVEFLGLSDMLRRAPTILSTVTTDVALDAAKACVGHLTGGHVYLDLNATSPAVKKGIAAALAPSGAAFVEGAILGAVAVTDARTRILVCGEKGQAVARDLSALGLNVGFYGAEIGRASTFKLLRSIFSKGVEALLVEAVLAARRAGVGDDVWREIVETMDERSFAETGGNWVQSHGTAHARRYHEMVQVEAFLRELGIDPTMTKATVAFFDRSTRLALARVFKEKPKSPDDVVAALDDLLSKR